MKVDSPISVLYTLSPKLSITYLDTLYFFVYNIEGLKEIYFANS